MINFAKQKKIIFSSLLLFLFLFSSNWLLAQTADTDNSTVDELNKTIAENKIKIKDLEKQLKLQETNIQLSQAKAVTLANQLKILDNQIYKNNLKIDITDQQLNQTSLEIAKTTDQIAEKTKQVNNSQLRLSEFIRVIDKYDRQNFLTILAANDSFSSFFSQLNYLGEIQSQIKQNLVDYKQHKKELEDYYLDLNNKKGELDTLQNKLVQQRLRLNESKTVKDNLLTETKSSEKKFQKNIVELKKSQELINSEIVGLETTIRKKLEALSVTKEGFDLNQAAQLIWPVNSSRGISAYFHDPDYPFRNIFEHPAIDIRVGQGTPIMAAESGYVAKVKDGGYGYSYIMLIHGNGISTVYGHVSEINVKQDTYVIKGQIIGKSGAMPGTRGAGQLTTGPHLHFEVRKDGIPVNPLEYLP